jgi:hypothetical protein
MKESNQEFVVKMSELFVFYNIIPGCNFYMKLYCNSCGSHQGLI